jgi:hypothetical protein|tara:strand:+ start:47 stop:244 length:198 start_codon:yes stop_codon:yes gene_type:complete
MKITRTNPVNGEVNTLDLDITNEQMYLYTYGGVLIQDAFPTLSVSDREFFKTGITDDTWDEIFAG